MLARALKAVPRALEWTWTPVEPLNARSMLDAAASAAAKPADQPFVERRRRLTSAALEVVNQKVARAYSPIVIAGFVRLADFALLSLVGIALYVGYVMPHAGFNWLYPAEVIAVAVAAAMLAADPALHVALAIGAARGWGYAFLLRRAAT